MDTAVSLAADAGFDTELGGFANLAARLRFPKLRVGVAANATLTDGPWILVRPLGTLDFALRLEPDVRIWLGVPSRRRLLRSRFRPPHSACAIRHRSFLGFVACKVPALTPLQRHA